ncbi:hypothetical protein HQ533_03785 [Candidatus Woesearchaeota archaeon]|nr:hypothetical protein [Candidatus Woesearchaeota archaeon]
MGKAKRDKARIKKQKKMALAQKQSRLKTIIVGSILTVATVAITAMTANYFLKAPEVDNHSPDKIETRSVNINDYVDSTASHIDPDNDVTLYFILQQHNVDGWEDSLDELQKYRKASVESQISVYRILEYLTEKKGVEVLCNEGVFFDDLSDIENPNTLRETLPEPEYSVLSELFSRDNEIETLVLKGHECAEMFGLTHPEVYMVGFETEESPGKDASDKEKMEFIDKHLTNSAIRSFEAITQSLEHTVRLYSEGKIKNMDAAIVIGFDHFSDYEKMLDLYEDIPFNTVFIWTKGLGNSVYE